MSILTARLRYLSFALLGLSLVAGGARAQEASEAGPLVTPRWVQERFGEADLALLHIGPRDGYDAAHIPGAVHVSLSQISVQRGDIRLEMPETAELISAFESLGVSDNSTIVLYFGANWVTPTTRVYLTLDFLGLGARTHILDGGLQAWQAEGLPVTVAPPSVERGSLERRAPRPLIVDAEWLNAHLEDPRIAVVDARTPNYYSGHDGGHGQIRAGHVRGARNIPFTSLVDEATLKLKDRDILQEMFEQAGIEPGTRIVSYCHIGQQATLVYFVARYLGYEAQLYDGSFNEWANRTELPVTWPAGAALGKLISTDQLAAMLEDTDVSVLDVRSDLVAYLQGHIPGAAYLHFETLRATADGVPADLLAAEHYAALFARLGVSRDRPVVLYSDGEAANVNATFVAWILAAFQHPAVYLLDGGYGVWEAEGRFTSRSYPEVEATRFAVEPFNPHLIRRRHVEGSLNRPSMVIVDVRPVDQFDGRAGPQLRRGHIPGAINHLWSSDLVRRGNRNVWRSAEELRADYERQGITPDKHIILYCNTGTEATHVYFALRNLLGYPMVDVYFPSWTDWSAREELPVERRVSDASR